MNREDLQLDVIDLGAVSVETKGALIGVPEDQDGLFRTSAGLTDD